ncbi:MAG: hypothetical protein GXP55_17495 [Deltaproteobacteria bacterium]|nr:hypothetical protein [Deltaproteobacteria bacterium]
MGGASSTKAKVEIWPRESELERVRSSCPQRLLGMERKANTGRNLGVEVDLETDALKVCVRDARSDVLAQFADLTEAQRVQLARDSWMIGLSAVSNAYARAQEAKLADVGQRLVQDLDTQLAGYLGQQEAAMKQVLSRFFDPTDGQVTERLRAFLDDQGVLAKVLHQYVGADNSVLSEALARQVGETSPLFKLLSPTESEGLVQLLGVKVEQALDTNRAEVARALDPLEKSGAVGRFLTRLREDIESADEDRQQQLITALAALDQNDEGSLISALMRETRAAHDVLRRAMNPQLPDSPIAIVRRTLEEMLSERLGRHEKRLEAIQTEQRQFQTDLRSAVARIETRRDEQAKSTRGGGAFEDDVVAFVTSVVPAGLCTVEATGSRTGLRPNCKVGDVLVRFSEESAFCGCGFVIEAKRDKSYQVGRALEELETAMANRGAQTGLFVMASSTAPPDFPGFARFGSRLVVTWNPDDPVSDGLLHGAVVAGLALAQRKKTAADPGDINALADVEQRIFKEITRLEKIDKSATGIRTHADRISDEVRKARKELERVVGKAKATLRALDVELREEDVETASPIEVDAVAAPRPEAAE